MLHDTIKNEAHFKCFVDGVSTKRPARSAQRLVAQTTVDRLRLFGSVQQTD